MHEPSERKGVEGLEPAVVCMAALVAATGDDSNVLVEVHCDGW